VRELDRLGEDLAALDTMIAESALADSSIMRLITITGVNLTVAAGLAAAIGDIRRFASPQKLVSYFGLNPRVGQSGLGAAHHGRISKSGAATPVRCWSKPHGRLRRHRDRCMPSSSGSGRSAVIRSPPSHWRASSRSCAGTC
jgi:transposase